MYDYGYAELAAAIVKQAVDDWRHICKTARDLSSDTKRHQLQYKSSCASFGDLQAFFESNWCDLLCGCVDPAMILTQLNAERNQARQNKAPGTSKLGRKPRIFEHNGEKHSLSEWAKLIGVNGSTLNNRLRRGWTIERVLSTDIFTQFRRPR